MADHSDQIGQDEIENLLRQAQDAGGASPADSRVPAADPPAQATDAAALAQQEIEQLMAQDDADSPAKKAAASSEPSAVVTEHPSAETSTSSAESTVSQNDVELLLNKAEKALASIDEPRSKLPTGIQTFQFKNFSGTSANTESATLELMGDVQLDLTIELGRTHMHLEDVLKLQQGAVVPLDKLAGDPADIYVNGRLVARGEVLVLNDNFCVRVAELIVGESACA
jgi:flagellar motor switch protein FliN/FliY